MREGGLAKSNRFLVIIELRQGGGLYVSEGVCVGLVVTARQEFAGGGDDRSAPCPETTERERFAVVTSVGALDVPAVSGIRRNQRMTIGVVVELRGLEDQTVGTEVLVLASESRPFVFVRTETEDLELYYWTASLKEQRPLR